MTKSLTNRRLLDTQLRKKAKRKKKNFKKLLLLVANATYCFFVVEKKTEGIEFSHPDTKLSWEYNKFVQSRKKMFLGQ